MEFFNALFVIFIQAYILTGVTCAILFVIVGLMQDYAFKDEGGADGFFNYNHPYFWIAAVWMFLPVLNLVMWYMYNERMNDK